MVRAHDSGRIIKGVKGCSPFAGFLHFDLVFSYTFDYMHTVCLGLVKHLGQLWNADKCRFFSNYATYKKFNKELADLKSPKIFTRSLDSLENSKDWKAAQCRDFLLFKGPAILEGKLNEEYHQHFLKISVAIGIFLKDSINENDLELASKLLMEFVFEFESFYGKTNMRFNTHLLTHIPMSVLYTGPLWCHSLFSYESMNHFVNNYIKGTHNIISEAALKISIKQQKLIGVSTSRRIEKKHLLNHNVRTNCNSRKIMANEYPDIALSEYREINNFVFKNDYFESYKPNKKTDDSYICLISGDLVRIEKILVKNNNIFVLVKKKYEVIKTTGHHNSVELNNSSTISILPVTNIKQKAIFFEEQKFFFVHPNMLEFF